MVFPTGITLTLTIPLSMSGSNSATTPPTTYPTPEDAAAAAQTLVIAVADLVTSGIISSAETFAVSAIGVSTGSGTALQAVIS